MGIELPYRVFNPSAGSVTIYWLKLERELFRNIYVMQKESDVRAVLCRKNQMSMLCLLCGAPCMHLCKCLKDDEQSWMPSEFSISRCNCYLMPKSSLPHSPSPTNLTFFPLIDVKRPQFMNVTMILLNVFLFFLFHIVLLHMIIIMWWKYTWPFIQRDVNN